MPTSPSPQPMAGQPGYPGSPGMPTNGAMNQASMGDRLFLQDAMQDDDAQVEMSRLAQQKSSSPDVKQFGQQMVKVHTALNNQLAPAAKQMDVSAPKGPSKKEKKQIEKLQALSGSGFDTAYIQAMAKEQEHDLKEFKSEAADAQSRGLQQVAKADVPVLTQHYQILEKVAQAHNVTLEGKKK